MWFLPGAEAVFARGDEALRLFDRPAEALGSYRIVAAALPGVGVARSKVAFALYRSRRFREACDAYRPLVRAGMIDDASLPAYGHAALEAGRYAEARDALARALPLYPDDAAVNAARLAEAERHLR